MNGDNPSDMGLLGRYVAGDVSAFEVIHKKYVGLVYSVCLRCLRVPQDAEDATAACFVVLANKAGKIEAGGNFVSWLYSCALRIARNAARLRKHRAERETEVYNMDLIQKEGRDRDWEAVLPHVERQIAELPTGQRETMILRFYEGLSMAQVAERLGCSEVSIRGRLHSGLKTLRKRLARFAKDMNEDMILSGMSSTALILPVPYGVILKLAAIAKGEPVGGAVLEIVRATMRNFMWAKVKLAAVVVGAIAVPVAIAAVGVFGPLNRGMEAQVETLYEAHFGGATLSDFWEKVEPAEQVTINEPGHKSALVLRAAGKGATERLKPEVKLVSRPIDLTKGIVEIVVVDEKVVSFSDKGGKWDFTKTIVLCDELGQDLVFTAYAGNDALAEPGEKGAMLHGLSNIANITKLYLLSSGDALVFKNSTRVWGHLAGGVKTARLEVVAEAREPTVVGTWPIRSVVVRRLQQLPPPIAKERDDAVARQKAAEAAEAKRAKRGD